MGWFRKINKNGEDYKPIGNVITATSLSVSGPDLADGDVVRVMFTTDIADANTPGGTTPLALTWNGGATPIPVKASKEGSLASVYAHEVATNIFKYITGYVTLEMMFDGTNLVIIGNPVVLSGSDYTIYADGQIGDSLVGDIKASFSIPYGWLACDKTAIVKADYPKLIQWATDNNLIGSGKLFEPHSDSSKIYLPDLREVTLKGTGLTSKSSKHYDSDGLDVGEFIDDRVLNHKHECYFDSYGKVYGDWINQASYIKAVGNTSAQSYSNTLKAGDIFGGAHGATNEVKAVGVIYIIKAM